MDLWWKLKDTKICLLPQKDIFHFHDLKLLTIFGELELEREKFYQKKNNFKRRKRVAWLTLRALFTRCRRRWTWQIQFLFSRKFINREKSFGVSFQFENVFKYSQKTTPPMGSWLRSDPLQEKHECDILNVFVSKVQRLRVGNHKLFRLNKNRFQLVSCDQK